MMADRDILAIGASAGGVDALMRLARHFRPGFPAAVSAGARSSPAPTVTA
jgi:chemotaxis response regulator CheB